MSGLLRPVEWLWAFSILAQLVVFALLFLKGNSRKLPVFTTYVALNLSQAGVLLFVYSHFGSGSHMASVVGWTSEAATLLAQALATTEVLWRVLRPYQGIWGLGWRLLVATSILVLVYVVARTHGDWDSVLFEANRGYHCTFAIAVISCLVLVRHYSIPVPGVYKALLGGFCFFSCTMILINTILQAILYDRFEVFQPVWQFTTILSFAGVQIAWAAALRKPLPEQKKQPVLVSDAIYQRLSPEINHRLSELNERLLRLWNLEARPH